MAQCRTAFMHCLKESTYQPSPAVLCLCANQFRTPDFNRNLLIPPSLRNQQGGGHDTFIICRVHYDEDVIKSDGWVFVHEVACPDSNTLRHLLRIEFTINSTIKVGQLLPVADATFAEGT